MKKIFHYFTTLLTVFVFGYLLMHSADVSDVETNDSSKEIGFQLQQNDYHFNAEGIQKESISLKSNQNQTNVNEVVRKQVQSLFVFTSFVQIELLQKNSFEVFFGKKNLLNLFFTTSRIIFPFHYFW
ncbi:hypothetical protein [Flavobacterium sp. N2820]|uniref:hypothetical protein n=1 Tax=Flavobacterium sp. N2820 TaxID=2986834 RepID=UPI0022242FFF|nr:hypothetical protein [Flavobacterium sp. N2820]